MEHALALVTITDDDPSMRAAMISLVRSFGREAKAFPAIAARFPGPGATT